MISSSTHDMVGNLNQSLQDYRVQLHQQNNQDNLKNTFSEELVKANQSNKTI